MNNPYAPIAHFVAADERARASNECLHRVDESLRGADERMQRDCESTRPAIDPEAPDIDRNRVAARPNHANQAPEVGEVDVIRAESESKRAEDESVRCSHE
ncbi:MAG TPA: hypothetical protein VLV86_20080, partial [Vicinamibacterales bacterium]|nr:hypothetical protein [Vicinamibacterales bacterium]